MLSSKNQQSVSVAVVNFRVVWGDKQANLEKFKNFIGKAASLGANFVVFPECALTGYEVEPEGKMHKNLAETIPGPSTNQICKLASKHNIYIVFGMPEVNKNDPSILYNSAALIGPNGLIGHYRKTHLWKMDLSWCQSGNKYPVFLYFVGRLA